MSGCYGNSDIDNWLFRRAEEHYESSIFNEEQENSQNEVEEDFTD